MEKDHKAALSPRMDINGVACGLVKVALKEASAEFEVNVMSDCSSPVMNIWSMCPI